MARASGQGQDIEFTSLNLKYGEAHSTDSHTIHIPNASSFPQQTYSASNVTAPYKERNIQPIGTQRSQTEPIDTVIYFTDKLAVNFKVTDGQNATAGELFELVVEEFQGTNSSLPPDARDIFALWLVSDHLELQLKPSQVPFKLVCMWDDLLRKYTSLGPQEIDRDEPVIMFERNVFYSRTEEKKIDNEECLRLLYHEARENIADGRYPLSDKMSHDLAGIQALINAGGQYNSSVHTAAYYEDKVKEYYPPTQLSSRKSMFGKGSSTPAQRLAEAHRTQAAALSRTTLKELYRAYLEECWRLPFYGAAYFGGQIEHPSRRIFSNPDDPVYIAINPEGVFVIDMDDVVFLVGVLFSDISWTYAVPSEDKKENLPCLFIKFRCEEKSEVVTKIFQIFSKQASLADTLMQTCKKLFMERAQKDAAVANELDMLDGMKDGMIRSEDKVWGQFDKLCMITHRPSDQTLKGNVRGFKNQTLSRSRSQRQQSTM